MRYLENKLGEIFGTRKRATRATSRNVSHVLTWPDGSRSVIRQNHKREWTWSIANAPGVTGIARTLREAIEDARSDGAVYSKEQKK